MQLLIYQKIPKECRNSILLKVHLTHQQHLKLGRGEGVQLHHEHHTHAALPITLMVHKRTLTRAHKAHRNGKGIRLNLTQREIEASGLWDKIKSAANWVKNKVIDTKPYQEIVRPILNKAIDYIPSPEAQKALHYIGNKTGAAGLHGHHHSRFTKGSAQAKEHMARLRAMRGKQTHGGSFMALG